MGRVATVRKEAFLTAGLPPARPADEAPRSWTFLTNHAHVLLCLAAEPDARIRDVATRVGITERAALRIVRDLEEGGYLARDRVGRRTHYRLRLDRPMRHPVERSRSVRVLVEALAEVWRG